MAFIAADQVENPNKPCLKILVVDDEELNRRLMRILLIREGHDVQVVANGMEAIDAVKDQNFDIVFMDLNMPIMDGIEASSRIREWENGNGHTYIVALTASFLPENGQILFKAGIDNYISKPFEVAHIQRLVNFIASAERTFQLQDAPPTEEVAAGNDVLNVHKGAQWVGGDLETYKELLSDFVQELPERIKTMEKLNLDQDTNSLARAAHSLMGISLNLGALQLSACAAKLDKPYNGNFPDPYPALIVDLKRAEKDLRKTATDFLANEVRIDVST
ncbi:MAG TPA: response regulator [Anaerolineales bacterium]|nr:response regulator [Anaerolineales bacterium]